MSQIFLNTDNMPFLIKSTFSNRVNTAEAAILRQCLLDSGSNLFAFDINGLYTGNEYVCVHESKCIGGLSCAVYSEQTKQLGHLKVNKIKQKEISFQQHFIPFVHFNNKNIYIYIYIYILIFKSSALNPLVLET